MRCIDLYWKKGFWVDNPAKTSGWRREYARKAVDIVDKAILKMMEQSK